MADLSKWWLRLPAAQEPTPRELRGAFSGIPEDPRTGVAAGLLWFELELEARIAERAQRPVVAPAASQLSSSNRAFLAELRAGAAASSRRAR